MRLQEKDGNSQRESRLGRSVIMETDKKIRVTGNTNKRKTMAHGLPVYSSFECGEIANAAVIVGYVVC